MIAIGGATPMSDNEMMLEPEDAQRVKTVAFAIVVAMMVVSAVTAALFYAAAPEFGGWAALGTGAMLGFWTCPLFGGVAGNGLHEWRMEQAAGADAELHTMDHGSAEATAA
jgi:hypothetical protein